MGQNNRPSTDKRRQTKVGRLINEYDLTKIGEELERRRRGQDTEVHSLRDLATFFNQELIKDRISAVDTTVLDGEADNLYRLLTNDTVSSGHRTRAKKKLEHAGIDVDQLERDFVSREAIRTYLKRRGVSRPNDDTDQVVKEGNRIRQLRTKTATVTEDKVEHLRKTDRLSLGEFRVLVDIQIFCEDCSTQYGVDELLQNRVCDCSV